MKNNNLKPAYDALRTLPLVKVDAGKISQIFDLMSEIENQNNVYQKQREGILFEYGINPSDPDSQEKYAAHEKIAEITKRVSELDLSEAAVLGRPILDREKLFECIGAAAVSSMAHVELLLPLIVAPESNK